MTKEMSNLRKQRHLQARKMILLTAQFEAVPPSEVGAHREDTPARYPRLL